MIINKHNLRWCAATCKIRTTVHANPTTEVTTQIVKQYPSSHISALFDTLTTEEWEASSIIMQQLMSSALRRTILRYAGIIACYAAWEVFADSLRGFRA
jgi:hypothetical protein